MITLRKAAKIHVEKNDKNVDPSMPNNTQFQNPKIC
jgi:hypothetical protein